MDRAVVEDRIPRWDVGRRRQTSAGGTQQLRSLAQQFLNIFVFRAEIVRAVCHRPALRKDGRVACLSRYSSTNV